MESYGHLGNQSRLGEPDRLGAGHLGTGKEGQLVLKWVTGYPARWGYERR
jgi:hypothetical protein